MVYLTELLWPKKTNLNSRTELCSWIGTDLSLLHKERRKEMRFTPEHRLLDPASWLLLVMGRDMFTQPTLSLKCHIFKCLIFLEVYDCDLMYAFIDPTYPSAKLSDF